MVSSWAQGGGIGLRGLSLIFVYVVTVAISVSAFTALSFQNEIRGREIEGRPFTVGRLTALITQLTTQEDRSAQAREAVASAEKALVEAEAEAFRALSRVTSSFIGVEQVDRALSLALSRLKSAPQDMPLPTAERISRYSAMLDQIDLIKGRRSNVYWPNSPPRRMSLECSRRRPAWSRFARRERKGAWKRHERNWPASRTT